ncbi:hypothetical protein ANCCEY_07977 [Ancylostoma ceylanicum]|uniref:Uncharacterized protein n=1 Tax=Ancylostoma ceylanicum TaxID=53326 RepID=A0A0D6LLI7_9BILA|nr:hypothetical protein ANCCEY_07977 [Ancylostoma ceylanicum]
MHYQPPSRERAFNLSILTVSEPALPPYNTGTETLSLPGCSLFTQQHHIGSLDGIVYGQIYSGIQSSLNF